MTTDKPTPTHSMSGRGQAPAPPAPPPTTSPTVRAPEHRLPGLTPFASHLSDFLPQGDRLRRTNPPPTHPRPPHTPSSPCRRSFRTGKPPSGLLHRCADVTFALGAFSLCVAPFFPRCFPRHRPPERPLVRSLSRPVLLFPLTRAISNASIPGRPDAARHQVCRGCRLRTPGYLKGCANFALFAGQISSAWWHRADARSVR